LPDSRQRPCVRGLRCRSSETTISDDGETVTTPALGYDTFCQSDRNAIARALGGLPEQWVRVWQELPVKAAAGEHVTMSRTAPVPLSMAADALLREVSAVLCSWDEAVRMAAGLTLPDTQLARQRRDGPVIAAVVRTLTAHLDRLLALPLGPMSRSYELHDLGKIPEGTYGRTNTIGGYAEVTVDLSGADAGEEILNLAYRCRSFLGETRMTERLDAPCPDPSCSGFSLERVQGSAYAAECKDCGRLMSSSEWTMWTRIYAAGLTESDIPEDVYERDKLCAVLNARLAGKAALRDPAQVVGQRRVSLDSKCPADRPPSRAFTVPHGHNPRVKLGIPRQTSLEAHAPICLRSGSVRCVMAGG
jgi:hypothetical protein